MALPNKILSLVLLFVVCSLLAYGDDNSLGDKCGAEKMAACLAYATGESRTPSKECCDSAADIMAKDPACMGIQEDKLLQLPYACKLANASISNCPSVTVVKNIFILAGQSNMAGRGGVSRNEWDGVVPPECQSNPSILRLSAGLDWVEAQEPLHQDIDVNRTCGVGPGMSFANMLLKCDPEIGVIGLVPCAVGDTKITQWARGGWLYNELIRRTNAAMQSGGGIVRAMLWYQGESDAMNLEDALSYKCRLKKFFKNVRKDLQLPTLPIIQVALASASRGSFKEVIRAAQFGIKLPNVSCVDAKGFPVGPDLLHLTTPAQVQLGHLLADAFLQNQY